MFVLPFIGQPLAFPRALPLCSASARCWLVADGAAKPKQASNPSIERTSIGWLRLPGCRSVRTLGPPAMHYSAEQISSLDREFGSVQQQLDALLLQLVRTGSAETERSASNFSTALVVAWGCFADVSRTFSSVSIGCSPPTALRRHSGRSDQSSAFRRQSGRVLRQSRLGIRVAPRSRRQEW